MSGLMPKLREWHQIPHREDDYIPNTRTNWFPKHSNHLQIQIYTNINTNIYMQIYQICMPDAIRNHLVHWCKIVHMGSKDPPSNPTILEPNIGSNKLLGEWRDSVVVHKWLVSSSPTVVACVVVQTPCIPIQHSWYLFTSWFDNVMWFQAGQNSLGVITELSTMKRNICYYFISKSCCEISLYDIEFTIISLCSQREKTLIIHHKLLDEFEQTAQCGQDDLLLPIYINKTIDHIASHTECVNELVVNCSCCGLVSRKHEFLRNNGGLVASLNQCGAYEGIYEATETGS